MNDENRQTGRTTRQLIKLIDELLDKPDAKAVYFVANHGMVGYVQDRIRSIVGPHNPVRARIDVRARPDSYEHECRGRQNVTLVQDHFWPAIEIPESVPTKGHTP